MAEVFNLNVTACDVMWQWQEESVEVILQEKKS
jgi:hypothetical protein